jgi:four helix bundle protein
MASNTYLENMLVSQKARNLVRDIYKATREHKTDAPDWGLAEQMHRASICIMKSVEDGFQQTNPPDFHRCLAMAKGSCAEIRSQLHMALDIGYITPGEFARLMESASDIAHLLGDLRCPIPANSEMRHAEPA